MGVTGVRKIIGVVFGVRVGHHFVFYLQVVLLVSILTVMIPWYRSIIGLLF